MNEVCIFSHFDRKIHRSVTHLVKDNNMEILKNDIIIPACVKIMLLEGDYI